jgi:hypothetical protein
MPNPAHRYYTACIGTWRAPIDITLTDATALRCAGMSLPDRLAIRLLAAWPRWIGPVTLDTSVAFLSPNEVEHRTLIRWRGLTLRRSVERYSLQDDGQALTISEDMQGHGTIDETATRATYTLRWLGVEIHQHTLREGDRVTVHQVGPGFSGVQRLERLGA